MTNDPTTDPFWDPIAGKRKHDRMGGGGYLSNWCAACGADEYERLTQYCIDEEPAREQKKLDAERREALRKSGLRIIKLMLTEEEYNALDLNKLEEYRPKDRICIKS